MIPTRHINMAATVLIAVAIQFALDSVSALAAEPPVPRTRNVAKELLHQRISVPVGWSPVRWTMSSDLVVVSEWIDQANQITATRFYRVKNDRLVPTGMERQRAGRPTLIGDGRILLLEDNQWVVRSTEGDRVYGKIDISKLGLLGEGTLIGKYYMFHTIHDHVVNPITRMFAIDLEYIQLIEIDEGFYPILLPGGRVLYVEIGPKYRLCQTSLPGLPTRFADRKPLTGVPFAWIKPGVSEGEIICQYGGFPWHVARVSLEGLLIRNLSRDGFNSFAPWVSPSRRFVAYSTVPGDHETQTTTIVVVDSAGTRLFSMSPAFPSISSFGWATDGDRLGIIVSDDRKQLVLDVIDFDSATLESP